MYGVHLGSPFSDYPCVTSKAGWMLACLLISKRKPENYSPSTEPLENIILTMAWNTELTLAWIWHGMDLTSGGFEHGVDLTRRGLDLALDSNTL